MAPCNCRKRPKPAPRPKPTGTNSGTTQTFVLNMGGSRTLTFGSQLEAEAANARQGGTGKVTPKN